MTRMITPFTEIPAEPLAAPSTEYPYLVISIMSAVYQRDQVEISQGETEGKCINFAFALL